MASEQDSEQEPVDLRDARTPAELTALLEAAGYLPDEGLATALLLALRMQRPLFLEGEPGVGKTEVARTLAVLSGAELIRLQCYEGIDAAQAVYEWDYSRQILHLRAAEAAAKLGGREGVASTEVLEDELFSERFLVARPLLAAMRAEGTPPLLLIDEVDRADDEFEAFLLEALSDYSVTVPELGTFTARVPPICILTSNRTREVHDALKRRCLYHWVEHPDPEREAAIIASRAPQVPDALARAVATVAQRLRGIDLYKPPGVAESIDWAVALDTVGADELAPAVAHATIGSLLKNREDTLRVDEELLAELITGVPNP